jgi:spore germination cell wall hydrolase CwlJ-like protein
MKPEDAPIFARLTDAQLLALTIYCEARNQPYLAQVGVAWAIMLRVKHPSWMGKTVHEVILKPNQFSEYNSNDPEYVLAEGIAANWNMHYGADNALRVAEGIATGVLQNSIPNPFGRDDVLYFREEHVHPNYEKTQTMVMKAGTTTFWVDNKKSKVES